MERAVLTIEGMSCGHCVGRVRAALQNVPGVVVGEVTVGRADVQFDPAKTDGKAVAEALGRIGYPARVQAGASAAAPDAGGRSGCGCG